MNNFFLHCCFLSLGYVLCAQIPDQLPGDPSDDNTLGIVSPLSIILMTKEITCDPGLIKLRDWDFDQAADVSTAFSCLTLCAEKGSFDGILAMMEMATPDIRHMLFDHSVCEALAQKNSALVIKLLAHFHTYPLHLLVFVKVRASNCKEALPSFMRGWKYRYPGDSALYLMDEIVASCVYFNQHHLLYAFLSVCPFVSAGTISAYEDAVLNNDTPIRLAILKSGVLGTIRPYSRMSDKAVKLRRLMRSHVANHIMGGALWRLRDRLDDIEIPFVIEMIVKSVYQPQSFVYLINRYCSSLLKSEALSIFKAACFSGNRDVLEHALKVLSNLKYDLHLIFQAFRNGSCLGPVQIIECAVSSKYVPEPNEVGNCVALMINDPQAVSRLLKTWPQHLGNSEVFTLFPRLIETGNRATILAAIQLWEKSSLFTYHRYLAWILMGETNYRGAALQQQKRIQEDPELLTAVLRTLDPNFFGRHGRPCIEYWVSNVDDSFVQKFLQNSTATIRGRVQRCVYHLTRIKIAMNSKHESKTIPIKMFIRDGGSWEELALLAVQNPNQENLLKQALRHVSIDPFVVDSATNRGLLDWPGLSEESREIILRAQMRRLSRSKRLGLLWKVLPVKDVFLIIVDRYRLIAIDSHRKVFNAQNIRLEY